MEKKLLRTDNAHADRATTHQWLISSSSKEENEGFILAAHIYKSISTQAYQSRILKNGADPNCSEACNPLSA